MIIQWITLSSHLATTAWELTDLIIASQDFMVGDKAASFLIRAVAYFTAIHMCLVYLVHGWRQRSYTKGLRLDHQLRDFSGGNLTLVNLFVTEVLYPRQQGN